MIKYLCKKRGENEKDFYTGYIGNNQHICDGRRCAKRRCDAATRSYSGDLKTPATAPTKKGYTFTGWRVDK